MRELRGMDVAEDVLSVSARYGERERDGGRDGSRDFSRDRARERGHTNPKSHSKSNRTKTGERRSAAYLFSRPKKIYTRRERDSNPPREPLDATLKIEIERRHRAKDESNDAPRESQQSTIRQTFVFELLFFLVRA